METPEVSHNLLTLLPTQLDGPTFSVMGVGGAGINVLNMVGGETPLRRIAADTDQYFLALCRHEDQLDLGLPVLEGRGTRGSVELGRSCALAHESRVLDVLEGDIILLVAGLGRGTGTGATPVIASLARRKGLSVLSFLVWPFTEEGLTETAEAGLASLREHCDALMILDNDAALEVCDREDRRDAAMVVNDMIAQMIERLVGKVGEAFPFSVHDEIVDFVEGLPSANEELPLRAAELAIDPLTFEPIAMDGRGRIDLK